MSKRRPVSLLPVIHQTTALTRFFGSTVDHLFQPGSSESVSGYIGRKPSYFNAETDFYKKEITEDRQNFQLEAAMVSESNGSINGLLFYDDLIHRLSKSGANVSSAERLFETDYYSWAPPIDIDKLSFFQNYYWSDRDVAVLDLVAPGCERGAWYTGDGSQTRYALPPKLATSLPENIQVVVDGRLIQIASVDVEAQEVVLRTPPRIGKAVTVYRYGNVSNGSRQTYKIPAHISSGTGNTINVFAGTQELTPDQYVILGDDVRLNVAPASGTHVTVTRIRELRSTIDGKAQFDASELNTRGVGKLVNGMRVRLVDPSNIFIGFDIKAYDSFLWDERKHSIYMVTGVGSSIELIPETEQTLSFDPHYTVIEASSKERSFWTRVNRWVHRSALEWSNDDTAARRAKRPIVEFRADLKMFNYGTRRLPHINGTITVAPKANGQPITVSTINGREYGTVTIDDGAALLAGSNILVSIDGDLAAYNELLFKVKTVIASGKRVYVLEQQPDPVIGDIVRLEDTLVEYWFTGATWVRAQERGDHPLFDLFDSDGVSIGDPGVYPETTFKGSKIFSYVVGTGRIDPVIGHPLDHDKLGQIVFENYQYSERFKYRDGDIVGYYYYQTGDEYSNQWHPADQKLRFSSERYAVPLNLQANPDFDDPIRLSKNDWFAHFSSLMENQEGFEGVSYKRNNWQETARALNKGTEIIQHDAPLLKLMLLMSDDRFSMKGAIQFVEREYVRFKLKFIHKMNLFLKNGTVTHADDIQKVVDRILDDLKSGKTAEFPFSISTIGGRTDFIPPSPSCIGIRRLVKPALFNDHTGATFVRGHDGSLVKSNGAFADQALLALEGRIFQSCSDIYNREPLINQEKLISGKYRSSEYTVDEYNRIMRPMFEAWARGSGVNYRVNPGFDFADPFTYNYSDVLDRDGDAVPGSWRAIYNWYFDTIYPNLTPWEMLGFSEAPNWWEGVYGPAPYTRGNTVLWSDIEAGTIRQGPRAGTHAEYARPNLMQVLPVDSHGKLLDPVAATIIPTPPTIQFASREWNFGDQGEVEAVWRRSSSFGFATALAYFLMKPARFVESYWDYGNRKLVHGTQWVDADALVRVKCKDLVLHRTYNEDETEQKEVKGIQNWLIEYIHSGGKDKTELEDLLHGLQSRLAHKMGGFTTKDRMTVSAENFGLVPDEDVTIALYTTPNIEEYFYSGVLIERTNFGWRVIGYNPDDPHFDISLGDPNGRRIKLFRNLEERVINPWKPNVFYKVGQYVSHGDAAYRADKNHTSGKRFEDNFWTIDTTSTPAQENLSRMVDASGDHERVSYGTEFRTKQEVIDFIYGYDRWLREVGFEFQDGFDWDGAVATFYDWTLVDWKPGAFITLSPAANELHFTSKHGFVLNLDGSRLLAGSLYDKAGQFIDPSVSVVDRFDDKTIIKNAEVYGARIQKGEVEHVLIFSNETIFDDLIYLPLLNLRQERLKLAARRSTEWAGRYDAPGFILLGDDLVPNYEKSADDLRYMFDIELADNTVLRDHARHVIGFQQREYLSKLLLNETQQFELYQGMIQQKGTVASFDKLVRSSKIGHNDSNLAFLEEWAFRLSDYGAYNPRSEIELAIDRQTLRREPQLIHVSDKGQPDWVSVPANDARWLLDNPSFDDLNGQKPACSYPLPDAGYVRLSDATYAYPTREVMNDKIAGLVDAGKKFSEGESIWVYSWDLDGFDVAYLTDAPAGAVQATSLTTDLEEEGVVGQRVNTNVSHGLAVGDHVLICNRVDLGDIGGVHEVLAAGPTWFEINASGFFREFTSDHPRIFKMTSGRVSNIAERDASVLSGKNVYVDDVGNGKWGVFKKIGASWVTVRSEPKRINTHRIVSALLYDRDTVITQDQIKPEPVVINHVLPLDPLAGLLPGLVEREIDLKLEYDPANYGEDKGAPIWGKEEIGKIWWDLSSTFYLNYYTDDIDGLSEDDPRYVQELEYRSVNWGRIAPNSSIDVYEWTRSFEVPTDGNFDLYSEQYVTHQEYDYKLLKEVTVYYFWAKNRDSARRFNSIEIGNFLSSPSKADIPWMAIISNKALILGAVRDEVSSNTVLQLKLQLTDEDDRPEHQEWELLRPGHGGSQPSLRLWNKMRDSLRGFDQDGNVVPAPSKRKVGIGDGQSMVSVENRVRARESFIKMINYILARHDFSDRAFDDERLTFNTPIPQYLQWSAGKNIAYAPIPPATEYTHSVTTQEELEAILVATPSARVLIHTPQQWSVWTTDSGALVLCKAWDHAVETLAQRDALTPVTGQRVLVRNTASAHGFWTVWKWNGTGYELVNTQTYRTSDFIERIDWYAEDEDVSSTNPPTMVYATHGDRNKRENPVPANVFVKINNDGSGRWAWTKFHNGAWHVVAREKATFKFSDDFFKKTVSYGFNINPSEFPKIKDRDGSFELGIIIDALRTNKILTDLEVNELWFAFVHFVHAHHDQIDWAFVTSFMSVLGLNERIQALPVAQADQSDSLLAYLDEVKPYRVTIRDFGRAFAPDIEMAHVNPTDFDKPFYLDPATDEYRRLTPVDASNPGEAGDLYRKWIADYNKVRKFKINMKLDRVWFQDMPAPIPHTGADAVFDFGSETTGGSPLFRVLEQQTTSFSGLSAARVVDRGRDDCVAQDRDGTEYVFGRNALRITDRGVLLEPRSSNLLKSGWDLTGWTVHKGTGDVALKQVSKSSILRPDQTIHPALCTQIKATSNNFKIRRQIIGTSASWTMSIETRRKAGSGLVNLTIYEADGETPAFSKRITAGEGEFVREAITALNLTNPWFEIEVVKAGDVVSFDRGQIEQRHNATSWIPQNDGAIVAREADGLQIVLPSEFGSSKDFTIADDFEVVYPDDSGTVWEFWNEGNFSAGTKQHLISHRWHQGKNSILHVADAANSVSVDLGNMEPRHKTAQEFDQELTRFRTAVNGSAVTSANHTIWPTGRSLFTIGVPGDGQGASPVYVKCVRIDFGNITKQEISNYSRGQYNGGDLTSGAAGRILSFYQPGAGMREKNLNSLLDLDFKGTILDGSTLESLPELDVHIIGGDGSGEININETKDGISGYQMRDPRMEKNHPQELVKLGALDVLAWKVHEGWSYGAPEHTVRDYDVSSHDSSEVVLETGALARNSVVFRDGVRAVHGVDYTVDQFASTVKVNVVYPDLTRVKRVSVHSFGFGSHARIMAQKFVKTTAATETVTISGASANTVQVTLNGAVVAHTVSADQIVFMGVADGQAIVTVYQGTGAKVNALKTKVLPYNVAKTWDLMGFSEKKPNYTSIIVEKNGLRLSPPGIFYGEKQRFVEVICNDVTKLKVIKEGVEYDVIRLNGTYNTVAEALAVANTTPYVLWEDKLIFNVADYNTYDYVAVVYENHDYTMTNDHLMLVAALTETDKLRISTFRNNASLDIRTWAFDSQTDATYRIVTKAQSGSSWLTVNGKRLVENIDYVLEERVIGSWDVEAFDSFDYDTAKVMDIAFVNPPSASGRIVITTFEGKQATSSKVWQLSTTTPDIVRFRAATGGARPFEIEPTAWAVDEFDPLRRACSLASGITSTDKQMTLQVNPFGTPAEMYASDPIQIPDPVNNIAGVVWVGSERIEYFGYARSGATITLDQLRRGTKGTSRSPHAAGKTVLSPLNLRDGNGLPKMGPPPGVGTDSDAPLGGDDGDGTA